MCAHSEQKLGVKRDNLSRLDRLALVCTKDHFLQAKGEGIDSVPINVGLLATAPLNHREDAGRIGRYNLGG